MERQKGPQRPNFGDSAKLDGNQVGKGARELGVGVARR